MRLRRALRRSTSTAILATSTAALLSGIGVSMALAAPATTADVHHEIQCQPNHVNVGGGCQIVFKDGHEGRSYGGQAANAGQRVCFTATNGDAVYGTSGNCSITDSHGNAYGLFQALNCGSSTITGSEAPEPGEPNGTAARNVMVVGGTCPRH